MIPITELLDALELDDFGDWEVLEKLEAAAAAFVEREANWHFVEVAGVSQIVTGNGSNQLRLRGLIPSAPATVSESAYVGATPATITASESDGYVVRTSGVPVNRAYLVRKHGYVWSDGYEYTVTATLGYTAGEEPAEIRELVRDLVLLKWAERDAAGGVFKSESIGPYTYTAGDLSRLSSDQGAMPAASVLAHWHGWVYA
jgi:hypothetical protein